MDSINPVYARLVLRALQRRNIDPAPLFEGLSLTPQALVTGGDITMEEFLQVLRVGHELSGDDKLGLMIGSNTQIMALGFVGSGMAVAPTMRHGLQVLETYTRLLTTYMGIRVTSTLDGVTIALQYLRDLGYVKRFHTESAIMMVQQYVESLVGLPLTNGEYRVDYQRPDYADCYGEWMHSPVVFGQDVVEVDIPAEWLDQPSPHYNPELWQLVQLSLSRTLASVTSRERYSRHIASLLRASAAPLPELGEAARGLHVSERTLNRRLREEGSSFRELKAQALAERAQLYLEQTELSVEAIAAELGYQDAANFRRAFKKSTGRTPQGYRTAAGDGHRA